jgi:hypothetical protein
LSNEEEDLIALNAPTLIASDLRRRACIRRASVRHDLLLGPIATDRWEIPGFHGVGLRLDPHVSWKRLQKWSAWRFSDRPT